jgi:hypothetical protein
MSPTVVLAEFKLDCGECNCWRGSINFMNMQYEATHLGAPSLAGPLPRSFRSLLSDDFFAALLRPIAMSVQ